MGRKLSYFIASAMFLLCGLDYRADAQSQSVSQSGPVTANHVTSWTYNGIVQDGGPATNGNLSELGITANGGYPFCIQTTKTHSGPYSQICEGINSAGGYIALNGYGGAAVPTLTFYINGAPFIFPSPGPAPALYPTPIRSVSTNYTVVYGDSVIEANASAGPITITFPVALGASHVGVRIEKTDTSSNPVIIYDGSNTVDAIVTPATSTGQINGWRDVYSNGTNLRSLGVG